jgi:GT2 family glycosyltransferase
MLKIISYPDIGIASGRRPDLFYDPGRFQYFKDNFEILERDGVFLEWDKVNNSVIYPWAMMSSELIEEVGYMSEDLGIDDVEYSYRVKRVNKKCVYIPNVVLLQPHGEEPQNHPEYAANRELVMMNWNEYQIRIQNPGAHPVYRGSRFIPGSITDPKYQARSDANYEFFKNYLKMKKMGPGPEAPKLVH